MSQKKIIILTAPSGSGKTTLAKYLLSTLPQLSFSVSATTRAPRPGEVHERDYYFLSSDDFQQKIKRGDFFEHQEVYSNQYYGTLYKELERIWGQNKYPLLDIDVKGAYFIEREKNQNTLSIFIKTSSIEILKQRLIARGTETTESLNKRLDKAALELEYARYFDYVISNDKLELAQKLLLEIVSDYTSSRQAII